MRKVTVQTEYGTEVRYYLTEEEAEKYKAMGFNIREGPRGGKYITEEDLQAGKRMMRQGKDNEKPEDDEKDREKELDDLLDELKRLYKEGRYEDALNVLDKIKKNFVDLLDEDEIEYLYRIEDWIIRKGSKDILGIELCKSVDKERKLVYERVCESLKVLSNFRNIDSIVHVDDNLYSIKLGNDVFEIKYDDNGNVSEIWYYDGGKKYKGREAIVRWLSKSHGRELDDVFNAFAETYGTTQIGNREIVDIKRRNAIINRIERVWSTRRGRGKKKIKWWLFIMMKAKEMGVAVKTIDDVIKLLSSDAIKELIREMFSVFKGGR